MHPPSPYPANRPRRLRRDSFTRALVREHRLSPHDLILPVFVLAGHGIAEPVASMPGVQRLTLDRLLPIAEECVQLGIPVMALFPVIESSLKTPDGIEATNPDGLVPTIVHALKQRFPELGILTDVALDPYTSHGQDGLLDSSGYILNDATVKVLTAQCAGPGRGRCRHRRTQRHDGRPDRCDPPGARGRGPHPHADHGLQRQVRERLLRPVPRRGGLGQQSRQGRQEGLPDGPGQQRRGLARGRARPRRRRGHGDGQPGMPYLDIVRRVKDEFRVPTFAYQVSGEYAMLKAAAQNGWLDHDAVMMESLLAFKRAGADGVLSYFSLEAARLLKKLG